MQNQKQVQPEVTKNCVESVAKLMDQALFCDCPHKSAATPLPTMKTTKTEEEEEGHPRPHDAKSSSRFC